MNNDAFRTGGEWGYDRAEGDLTEEIFLDEPEVVGDNSGGRRDVESETKIGEKIGRIAQSSGNGDVAGVNLEMPPDFAEKAVLGENAEKKDYADIWKDGKLDGDEVKMIKNVENSSDFADFNDEIEKMSEQYFESIGIAK